MEGDDSAGPAAHKPPVRWLPAAGIAAALAIGIAIGALVDLETAPDAAPAAQPERARPATAALQPGPALPLRLDSDLESFSRRAGALGKAPR